jgi:hypothetical protein
MCHGHTVRAECDLPGANGERISSSRDTGGFRFCSIAESGVGQEVKVTGNGAGCERRLDA